jgi:hypothetical protein
MDDEMKPRLALSSLQSETSMGVKESKIRSFLQ